ncbi:MAG TPA: hypothetical protein VFD92_26975 [Candidatus Binatia bacterium]|nr:hypothetical protein [Candidatus Binatia bacterium]
MSRPPKKRPYYKRHGLYVLKGALDAVEAKGKGGLLEGPAGDALREWRAALIADLGGEDAISAQERVVVDAATTTYLMLSSVDRFLLEQPSLVNRSRRKLFPVVLERQRLADSLVRYLEALGLRRRVREAPDVGSYLESKFGAGETGQPSAGGEERAPARDAAPAIAEPEGEGHA